jgi:hypothetical protein
MCGTTISRISYKMGLKERNLKRSTAKVSVSSVPTPASILPKLAKPEPVEDKPKQSIFIVPPTLKQLEKQKLQAEIAKAERDYKIFKR